MKRLLLPLLLFSIPVLADIDPMTSFQIGNINAICMLYDSGEISKKVAKDFIEIIFEKIPNQYIEKTNIFLNTLNNGSCKKLAP